MYQQSELSNILTAIHIMVGTTGPPVERSNLFICCDISRRYNESYSFPTPSDGGIRLHGDSIMTVPRHHHHMQMQSLHEHPKVITGLTIHVDSHQYTTEYLGK